LTNYRPRKRRGINAGEMSVNRPLPYQPSTNHPFGAHGVLIAIPMSLALWAVIGALIF
jgi:hypothetical protein